MAWTRWYSPKQARQLETDEITIAAQGTQGISDFVSVIPVRSISTSFGTFIREESNSLVFTDFGLPAVQPLGIEVKLIATRLARIQDKTIQLVYQNQPISENKQNLLAADTHVYGDAHDRWGITSDRNIPIESSEFGVIVDLQPHTSIPCASTVYIRSIQMRVAYPL